MAESSRIVEYATAPVDIPWLRVALLLSLSGCVGGVDVFLVDGGPRDGAPRDTGPDGQPPGDACDGAVPGIYYRDEDGDGWGDQAQPREGCTTPEGHVAARELESIPKWDCDDMSGTTFPGGTETCDDNNEDEDCDDEVDEATQFRCYVDRDGDTVAAEDAEFDEYACNDLSGLAECLPSNDGTFLAPSGWLVDCDDNDANRSPLRGNCD